MQMDTDQMPASCQSHAIKQDESCAHTRMYLINVRRAVLHE